jgi:Homeodomain-like domain
MATRYLVTLTAEERQELIALISAGKASALTITRARVLLKADQSDGGPGWNDAEIVEALDCGRRTVSRVRQRFVECGLSAALERKRQDKPSRERTFDGAAEARLIAIACSEPPEGRVCWTMQLLADKVVELQIVSAVSDETVRRTLKKTSSSRT